MEKYRYSNLTDDQHKKIAQSIESLKTIEAEPEAAAEAKFLNGFLMDLESMSLICPADRINYQLAIRKAMAEREAKRCKNSTSTAV